jgi:hypothetical protein
MAERAGFHLFKCSELLDVEAGAHAQPMNEIMILQTIRLTLRSMRRVGPDMGVAVKQG